MKCHAEEYGIPADKILEGHIVGKKFSLEDMPAVGDKCIIIDALVQRSRTIGLVVTANFIGERYVSVSGAEPRCSWSPEYLAPLVPVDAKPELPKARRIKEDARTYHFNTGMVNTSPLEAAIVHLRSTTGMYQTIADAEKRVAELRAEANELSALVRKAKELRNE